MMSRPWLHRNRDEFSTYRIGRNVRITRESAMQYRARRIQAGLDKWKQVCPPNGLTINEIREQVRASA